MRVLTTEEAAAAVGVSVDALRKWVERGHLAPLRAGARPLRFREGDVIECHLARMSARRHAELDELGVQLASADANV